MKTVQLLLIFVFSFALTQCQKEEKEIIDETPQTESIVSGSPLSGLISRTTQNPTACDNVLDNSSCFSVVLPVTVVVNGNTITVTTQNDYQMVQNAIDAFSNDDDIVNFNYPITIQFQNFTTQIISTPSQLDDVIDDCDDDNGLNEIDCISINYPIIINVYNTSTQSTTTVTIQNNSQLFNFINGLTTGVIAAIVYPISVTSSNGQNVVINNNSQLESFIEDSIDDCDDSGTSNPSFISILTTGNWYVSYFNEDDDVQTGDYNGYNFAFFGNGTIEVTKNSAVTTGTWSTYTDSGYNKLDLSFANPALDELQEDWIILEYTATIIRLKHVSGGNGGTDYLYFTKL